MKIGSRESEVGDVPESHTVIQQHPNYELPINN